MKTVKTVKNASIQVVVLLVMWAVALNNGTLAVIIPAVLAIAWGSSDIIDKPIRVWTQRDAAKLSKVLKVINVVVTISVYVAIILMTGLHSVHDTWTIKASILLILGNFILGLVSQIKFFSASN